MITIVVAEDHQLVRQSIVALLRCERDFHVLGEAADGFEAVRLTEQKHPDILLLSLSLPSVYGLEVTRQVRETHAGTQVIIVSMHGEESYVIEALRNGAAGYVLKDASGSDLIEGIRKVKLGRRYLSPSLMDMPISVLSQKAPNRRNGGYDSLSDRERLVLQMAAEGHTRTHIAALLSIAPRTAETHRTNLMRKLHLHSQTDLVRFAIRNKIIPA